jgi:predicted RNase H-like HicB family nuclease
MLSEFILKKLKNARYKLLKDGSYFGEIPGLKGVWTSAGNLEDYRKELQEVLEDWLLLKVRERENIPGFRLKIGKRDLIKTTN